MAELRQDAISEILTRGKIYEVGGVVRDKLMGRDTSSDIYDYIVTGIPYDDLTGLLRKYGRVDLVGKSFGVIKFTQFLDGEPQTIDIVLPRKEHSTGVGHKEFAVHFDPNLPVEEDLVRRDFTINALARALDTNELVDPLDGLTDLKSRLIRMTSPNSFPDDPLRMLRAVQFAARFEFTIEPGTYEAMAAHAGLINSVSPERIQEELNKMLLKAKHPSIGFRLMQKTGLLREVLPELEACVGVDQPGGYHAFDVFEHTLRAIDAAPQELHVRLAALFHDIRKPQHKRVVEKGEEMGATFYGHEIGGAQTAKKIMRRLRYGHDLTDVVVTLVERHMFTTDVSDKGLRRLVRKVGVPLIFDLLDLRRADVEAQGMGGKTDDVDQFEQNIKDELAKRPPFGLHDLAVNGSDIMKVFNLPPSPPVGKVLDFLLEAVLDDPALNTREQLLALAAEFFAGTTGIQSSEERDKESYE